MRYLPNRLRRGIETVTDLGCAVASKVGFRVLGKTYRDSIGIMEKKMEITIVYWGYIGDVY